MSDTNNVVTSFQISFPPLTMATNELESPDHWLLEVVLFSKFSIKDTQSLLEIEVDTSNNEFNYNFQVDMDQDYEETPIEKFQFNIDMKLHINELVISVNSILSQKGIELLERAQENIENAWILLEKRSRYLYHTLNKISQIVYINVDNCKQFLDEIAENFKNLDSNQWKTFVNKLNDPILLHLCLIKVSLLHNCNKLMSEQKAKSVMNRSDFTQQIFLYSRLMDHYSRSRIEKAFKIYKHDIIIEETNFLFDEIINQYQKLKDDQFIELLVFRWYFGCLYFYMNTKQNEWNRELSDYANCLNDLVDSLQYNKPL